MVKLSIYDENTKKKEKVQELEIGLKKDGDRIRITGRDKDGFTWYLLEIKPDGTFYRCRGMANDFGLQVDNYGRIKESK